jgi:precorrin-4 methylase
MPIQLTPNEVARLQEQVVRAQRRVLDEQKPDPSMYAAHMPREALLMEKLLSWSKLSIPIIAGVAVVASAVRTLQASA